MPTYNRAHVLLRALESALSQDFSDLEVVLIDDGSTDETPERVSSVVDPRVRYSRFERNRGIGVARREGVDRSRGDLIAFLDSDDRWTPGKLTEVVGVLDRHPEIDLAFSDYENVDRVRNSRDHGFRLVANALRTLSVVPLEAGWWRVERGVPEGLLRGNFVATPSVVVRRRVFDQVGSFREDLGVSEDLEFWWRAAVKGNARFAYTTHVLLEVNVGEDSITERRRVFAPHRMKAMDACEDTARATGRLDLLPNLRRARADRCSDLIEACAQEGRRLDAWRTFWWGRQFGWSPDAVKYLVAALAGPRGVSLAKRFLGRASTNRPDAQGMRQTDPAPLLCEPPDAARIAIPMTALRAGDWVRVRSVEEILATLDGEGSRDALPFMPEMLQHAGRRFQVFKSSHKTCAPPDMSIRRMADTVHLEGLRCDGEAHGGCRAGCLLFWKEAWLERVHGPAEDGSQVPPGEARDPTATRPPPGVPAILTRATRVPPASEEADDGPRYRCQSTDLVQATSRARWWDLRLYLRDLTSRNVSLWDLLRYVPIAALNMALRRANRRQYPFLRPRPSGDTTPPAELNLQPGEWVRVRSKDEIMRTVDKKQKNRGLRFDAEMVPYCGKTVRVLRRAEKFIDESTGRMIEPRGPCLILEGVACGGCLSQGRLFCPRRIYSFWREVWLERVEPEGRGPGSKGSG
jgi:GT2 family glycosyltransferase